VCVCVCVWTRSQTWQQYTTLPLWPTSCRDSRSIVADVWYSLPASVNHILMLPILTKSFNCTTNLTKYFTNPFCHWNLYNIILVNVHSLLQCVIPEAVIQFRCSWWWAKISLKTCRHVVQPRNNKLSYTAASCWSFLYIKPADVLHKTITLWQPSVNK
jgi:hypothetical protein